VLRRGLEAVAGDRVPCRPQRPCDGLLAGLGPAARDQWWASLAAAAGGLARCSSASPIAACSSPRWAPDRPCSSTSRTSACRNRYAGPAGPTPSSRPAAASSSSRAAACSLTPLTWHSRSSSIASAAVSATIAAAVSSDMHGWLSLASRRCSTSRTPGGTVSVAAGPRAAISRATSCTKNGLPPVRACRSATACPARPGPAILPASSATAAASSGGSSIRSTLAGSSASRPRTCCVASSCSSRQVSSSISGSAAAASAATRAISTDTGSDQCRSSSAMSSGWRAAAAAIPSTIAAAMSSRPAGPATAPSSRRGNSKPLAASERRHGHSGGMPAAEHAPRATCIPACPACPASQPAPTCPSRPRPAAAPPGRGRSARLPAPQPAQPAHGRGRRSPDGRQRADACAHSTTRPAGGEPANCDRKLRQHRTAEMPAPTRHRRLDRPSPGQAGSRLARYCAALYAGASPATVTAWIAETEAEKAGHEMGLRQVAKAHGLTEHRARRLAGRSGLGGVQ
jgi:hypothetical protein